MPDATSLGIEEKNLGRESEKIEPRDGHEYVTWEGPSDPTNPKNWPLWRKWVVTLLTSLGGLVTLMSGAMMSPALRQIGQDLRIGDVEALIAVSIFVLSFALGPLVLAPCSEVFGRKPVWVLSGAWYVAWNTVCGFAETEGVMIAARFLAGFGASSEFAISYPILGDCWSPDERGKSFTIATFIPLLGPALGPIIAGFITEGVGWSWLFWTLSIFDTILVGMVIVLLPETHAPTILAGKARKLSRVTGQDRRTEYESSSLSLPQRLRIGLKRPYRLLITQPVLQLLSLFLAYNFGVLYIMLSTFATLWIDRYHQSVDISGLHYISLVVGYVIASQVGGRMTDDIWARLKKRHGDATAPEYRVPLMVPGVALIPIGLFWYGWSAEARLHWIVPDIGAGIFGIGIILSTQAMQAYIMEAFSDHVASASAASQFLRNIFAFAFPICMPRMYETMDYGWGNSLLSFLFLAIGVPAPLILWKYGARLREKGKPQQ